MTRIVSKTKRNFPDVQDNFGILFVESLWFSETYLHIRTTRDIGHCEGMEGVL